MHIPAQTHLVPADQLRVLKNLTFPLCPRLRITMKERLVRKGSALLHQNMTMGGLTESKEDPLAGCSLKLLDVEENARREIAPRGFALRIIRDVASVCLAREDMVARMDGDSTRSMGWPPDDAINARRSLAGPAFPRASFALPFAQIRG